MSKYPNPKHGHVEKRLPLSTQFFEEPDEGREHIKKLAVEAGCNAILNLKYEKDTFSSGNYQYSVHAFKGDFAIVTQRIPCDIKEEAAESVKLIKELIEAFTSQFQAVCEQESEKRRKQLEGPGPVDYTGCLFILIILLILMLIVTS